MFKKLLITLIAVIILGMSCNILNKFPQAPHGVYVRVLITGGSLLVARGQCQDVDIDILRLSANMAVRDMRAVWGDILAPDYLISVSEMPVYMAINPSSMGLLANGIYWKDEKWIELRCDREFVLEHELVHAIGHQIGVWCYASIGCGVPGHVFNMDCTPCQNDALDKR